MIDVLIIGGFGITLILGLVSIPSLRVYFRTRMKSALLIGGSNILGAFSFLGLTIGYINFNSSGGDFLWTPTLLLCLLMLVVSAIMYIAGYFISYIGEYSFRKKIYEKTTFRQRLTGNIPNLIFEKPPPPVMSKRTGLICGITAITFGCLLILLHILFKIPGFTIHFVISGTFALIIGLLLVIFSIIYLDKGKKSPE